MYFLKILALLVSVIALVFCLFRLKQAAGAARLNDLEADWGGGSFSVAVKSFFRYCMWLIPSIVFMISAVMSCTSVVTHDGDSKTNKEKIEKSGAAEKTLPLERPAPKEQPTKTNDEAEKAFSKEEVEKMEIEKNYSGDDPIIRKRLGLPPKP